MKKLLVTLCLLCTPLVAQDKPEEPPKPPEKVTIVVPKGVLGEGKKLSPYVFDSTTKCFLSLANLPEGTKVAVDDWDLEDAPPDAEPLSNNTIIAFSQANPGNYMANIHGPYGYFKLWFEIKGSGPSPPIVDPDIPPGPGPLPPVPPVPVDPNVRVVPAGFRVMFIYETASKLTSKQSVILGSTRIRKYLDSKCDRAIGGVFNGLPEYRFWDKDGKDPNKDSPAIQAMWAGIKSNINPNKLPAVEVHENGKAHYHVLPEDATEDSVLTMLQLYGGK